jgi:hypothetical protein
MKPSELEHLPVKRFGITLTDSTLVVLLLITCVVGMGVLLAQTQTMFGGGRLHDQAIQLADEMADQIKNENNPKQSHESTLGAKCDNTTKQTISASNRVACWQDKVQQQLSNGSSKIYLDRTMQPTQYVIVVSWSAPKTGTASYILRVKPNETMNE